MRKVLILLLFLPLITEAQSVGVKDIPAGDDTTIEIRKGKGSDKEFEVVTDEDSIEGEAAPLLKEARSHWKRACAEWKSELKELNKDNQVLSMSCGTMQCSTVAMESTCRSTAKYKLKVRVK